MTLASAMRALPLCIILAGSLTPVLPAGQSASDLERAFTQTVQPFVTKYCVACHSGKAAAAQLDLREYSSVESVVHDPRWATVHDKVAARQMPPPQMPQPSDELRQQVVDWIGAVRLAEARKNAGDPGPVAVRRLSNAEYNYTIRDLTGVDMRPTREFPVDPANTAGFDNSAESLTMSPALLKKYLQAAHEVGDHLVLKQQGLDFAPYPMLVETDREKYAIQRIVSFYESQPTDYADYFEAAWRYKYRDVLETPGATLADVAAECKVSSRYLPLVWQILQEEKHAVGPIAKLQRMWRAAPAPSSKTAAPPRQNFVAMRDFVVRIRRDTARQFSAPKVVGLSATSQPLMNWKLQQFADHRRDFDPAALRMQGDPPLVVPPIPKYADLGEEAAKRWSALTQKSRAEDPDLIVPRGQRARYEAAFAKFSSVFPDAFYIRERGRYFPDDSEDKGRLLSAGYHNVMGYFRDDTPLMQLILDENGRTELNRLWDEFDFIADYTTRTWVQYFFNQSGEVNGKGRESGSVRPSDKEVAAEPIIARLRNAYLAKAAANPRNNPIAATAIREHFARVNAQIRKVERMRAESEARHPDALLGFAARAYRRPLTKAEGEDLLAYYRKLREKDGLTHEDAIRDSVVGVLMSPDFLFRMDLADFGDAGPKAITISTNTNAAPTGARPLSDYALANRLSYFLWSSMPDRELLARAAAGDLHRPDVLTAQVRRMLKDERATGMATEFAGNWLAFRSFETYNSVDRQRFPTFTNELREAMFQEPIHFMVDLIHNDRSVLDLLYGDYTFVNPVLASHYGMPYVTGGPETWVRVDDAHRYGRGGLLPMAVFLTENAPGLRTSPVKRGYWVVRRVLGEVIPPPPAVVPELPQDESKAELPLREMLAKHRSNAVCASCHARFDSFGLAFEGYGPVGEARKLDLAGRRVDTDAEFPGGVHEAGFEGVRKYIREHREKNFTDNLCREFLAYALGRSLMLSDEPLVESMNAALVANGYRFGSLAETIAASPQFLNRRAPDTAGPPESQKAALRRRTAPRPGVKSDIRGE